jgi:chromosome segregation ATPase
MTAGDDRLAERVTALEAEMAVVRQEAAAARALAAGADRDVAEYRAELRAHTRTLNALRETQLEHYAELKVDVAELKADVVELKAGISHIVTLLERLTPDA